MEFFKVRKIFKQLILDRSDGVTFIEVLLVAAILSVMVVITTPKWQELSDQINLRDSVQLVDAKVKFAKNQSLSALNDTNYGIHFEANTITLFAGNAYSAVDPANVVYNLPGGVEIYNVSLGGGSDLVFDRLTGTSVDSGSFQIRIISRPAESKTVYINSQGQVSVNPFQTSSAAAILEDTVHSIDARHIHFNLSGWSVQSASTTSLVLKKGDGTVIQTINAAPYFSAGIFDWQGSVTIDSASQKLRIHTLDAGGAILCIVRDRTENNKTINVSFVDSGYTENIVTYTENVGGTVTVSTGSGVSSRIAQ